MRILAHGFCVSLLILAPACAQNGSESEDTASGTLRGPDSAESALPEQPEQPEQPEPVSQASTDPDSIHILVNKQNPLDPPDYAPEDLREVEAAREFDRAPLREVAAGAYEQMFAAAAEEGIDLWVTTAYRDFAFQQALYEQRLSEDGAAAADRVSARPGHSEHQTGLAVDVADLEDRTCYLRACFGESAQGQWLAERSSEFGFLIRYPEGAEGITGFEYEPWHLRYVGRETAEDVTARGVTLEEYWGQPPAPNYDQPYQPNPQE